MNEQARQIEEATTKIVDKTTEIHNLYKCISFFFYGFLSNETQPMLVNSNSAKIKTEYECFFFFI